MKFPTAAAIAILFFSLARPASAQTEAEMIQALNNLQYEASTCVAYYTILQVCMEKEDDPELVAKVAETKKYLIDFALQIGAKIGITNNAMVWRVMTEQKKMQALVEDSCINLSSLLGHHSMRCKQVVEDGDSVWLEYLK